MAERISGKRIPDKVIDVTTHFLQELDKTPEVAQWAREHPGKVANMLAGYDQLVGYFNRLRIGTAIMEVMPHAAELKSTLSFSEEGRPTLIPTVKDMSPENYARGLRAARGPMLLGQEIKRGGIASPSMEDALQAIQTTSMDTTPGALVVGAMGHLIERTFFKWAESKGFKPEGGWQKDMLLRALVEVMMLHLASEGAKKPYLAGHFTKPNERGGLGWITRGDLQGFRKDVEKLFAIPS